jgi:hypothetical protein
LVESKPLRRQTLVVSGVPGNGTLLQSANAQSAGDTCVTPLCTPVIDSDEIMLSVKLAVLVDVVG